MTHRLLTAPKNRSSLHQSARTIARIARENLLLAWRTITRPRVINHMGIKINIGRHLAPHIRHCIFNGSYERGEIRPILAHLAPNDIVMEMGTGMGFISSFCARQIGSNRVYTFEANPEMEKHIAANFALNNLNPNLQIVILAQKTGIAEFYVEDQFWSSSTTRRSREARAVRVPTKPLNDEIKRINPTFLILDIEGSEFEVAQLIDFHRIQKVFLELHPYIIGEEKTAAVLERFHASGFRTTWASPDNLHLFLVR